MDIATLLLERRVEGREAVIDFYSSYNFLIRIAGAALCLSGIETHRNRASSFRL